LAPADWPRPTTFQHLIKVTQRRIAVKNTYRSIKITQKKGVATIEFTPPMLVHDKNDRPVKPGRHRELGMALEELRFDNECRVIVITGKDDIFCMTAPNHPHFHGHTPHSTWDGLQALQYCFQQVIETEKPIIAKVNGGVKGWGSSLVFSCDFIVARQDAVFCDHHMGMGDGNPPVGRPGAGIVPGDGGTIFVPTHMSPPLAREYLWLGKQLTGKQLYDRGCINAAVPAKQLDKVCNELVDALIRRPPYALAFSKRTFNRAISERFNLMFDLGYAYEMMNKEQEGRYVNGRGLKTL
jgi:enoyl-CoA hydratase